MSSVKRWRDTDHLRRAIDTAGGQAAFDTAVGEMLDRAGRRRGAADRSQVQRGQR